MSEGLLIPIALLRFSATSMNWRALQDDSSVYDETFVFGSFQLISAQRLLLDDRSRCAPAATLSIF